MSVVLFNSLGATITVNQNTEDILEAIIDVLYPHEYEVIADSDLNRKGLHTLNFVIGSKGLRWLFINHTYAFLDIIRQVGSLQQELRRGRHSVDASVVSTIILHLIRERAKEEGFFLKPDVGIRLVKKHLKSLNVPDDISGQITAEFRHHFKLYIDDRNIYSCGLNFIKFCVRGSKSSSGNVTRIR